MKQKAQKVGRVRAAVLGWLGRPFGLTDVEAWASIGQRNAAGANVSDHSVLQLSAVWACSRLISETIATLPLGMHERRQGSRRPAPQHHLDFILGAQPNADTISAVFWESVVAAMLLRGVARCEKLLVGGRLVGLQFLNPDRLSRTRLGDSWEYRYTDDFGRQRVIEESRIWSIPGWSLDGKNGVSVLRYGAQVFGAALATDEAAAGTFKRGLMPSVWFKYPNKMSKEQREEAREFITGRAAGAVNAGRPIILENGMEVGNLGINPVEAQLLQSRGYSVEEICRWFRVPPWMVGHTEKATSWGTGIEQQMIGFLVFTLGPWLKRIEQSIVKDLLTPAERLRYYPKFAVEGLLRADSAARAAFYSVMVNNGILTRDEVRELEDRAPMGGNAAVLTVQTALAPLDSLGSNTADQQARNAMANWLKDMMASTADT
ncbi:phage portal protein [Bordetella bronchiseptica]|uniref:Portal protein n=1 Tax=Bordetella bronchiseptica (strain ATCC BAA-588 / NCTC 13252 / RB50) TaxID=257310 RepID=A0A0H3LQ77_BORBR|nr:phage portal protein [Bordetella bronchiseptica]KDD61156.1 portal protein, HK97 family [Bordetella bronchiseptica OSU553]AMG88079.1 phage portal protein [Bordetella bronchiseptica]KCV53134.1 portal protein, HK97 family [Bordetella bronchiseptica 3E44]KDD54622.1 portal protein, HK97-like family protein [Bordetella bronchiseptica RB630]CAE32190.1 portal protein [Bordetella bronchiseptica RB50]